jgi:hypothetical protein
MNWPWATSLDQFWHSPTFPMWLTLAVAGFFAITVLIALLRAERSVANAALAVITLLALGMAAAETIRRFSPGERQLAAGTTPSFQPTSAALPALSCIDDLAGDVVLAACEKALFGSAESAAAALSYAASQITRLTAFGDVAAANLSMTPDLQLLRRSVEHDRYGLMAQVLVTRDHCSPSDCAAFQALTNHQQIATNMDERVYEGLIARYAPSWNLSPGAAAPVAMLSSSMPTGKPTTAEFPSASSTPPVSIMTPEPAAAPAAAAPRPAASSTPPTAPSPPARPAASAAPALAAAKKPAAQKHASPAPQHTTAPVQLAPPPGAPAPEASND